MIIFNLLPQQARPKSTRSYLGILTTRFEIFLLKNNKILQGTNRGQTSIQHDPILNIILKLIFCILKY